MVLAANTPVNPVEVDGEGSDVAIKPDPDVDAGTDTGVAVDDTTGDGMDIEPSTTATGTDTSSATDATMTNNDTTIPPNTATTVVTSSVVTAMETQLHTASESDEESDNSVYSDDLEQESEHDVELDGEPCLQSTRLVNAEYTSKLTNVLLKKMEIALTELGIIPTQLLPTMAVCDLYDILRRDLVSLLTLKTELNRKDHELNDILRSTTSNIANTGNSASSTNNTNTNTSTSSNNNTNTSVLSLNNTLFASRKFILPQVEQISNSKESGGNKNNGSGGGSGSGSGSAAPGRSNKSNGNKKNDDAKKVCGSKVQT